MLLRPRTDLPLMAGSLGCARNARPCRCAGAVDCVAGVVAIYRFGRALFDRATGLGAALLLAAARRIPEADRFVRRGAFERWLVAKNAGFKKVPESL